MDNPSEDSSDSPQQQPESPVNDDQRVYFVPYRWWKEAQESAPSDGKSATLYAAAPAPSYGGPMKIINNIFSPDVAFNLRREEESLSQSQENGEVGVSGRDYALVPGDIWLQALKWHSNSKAAAKNGKSFSATDEDIADVYPLQLRLSVLRETSSLGVRISKKDNTVECFRRACRIFSVDTEPLRIWDLSGRTALFFSDENNKILKDSQKQSEQDMLLELQVYGLSDSVKNKAKKDEMSMQYPNGSSFLMNGTGSGITSNLTRSSSSFSGGPCEAGTLGLTGLQNLGNTCFMNSALQCLAHTPKLVDYFLGDYKREINHDNPLGMNGEIASAFGDLLKKLWAPGATPVAPRTFKLKLAHFAPQFSGFNQHDSQELLAFLLDGLHEDLNRVKNKPYVEAKDGDDRPDEEIADEYWNNHLARNDSIIVDVCQGQYRSTLVCPVCKKVSIMFDPFMYLSLPLPSTSMRSMTVTVIKNGSDIQISDFTITVPKDGKLEDLIRALSTACSLDADETLLVAEIYNNRIIRYLEEPADSLSLIRDGDRLVAYQLHKGTEEAPLVVFTHQQIDEHYIYGKLTSNMKTFGIPLAAHSRVLTGSDIRSLYLQILTPFLVHNTAQADNLNCDRSATEVCTDSEVSTDMEPGNSIVNGIPESIAEEDTAEPLDMEFQFYLSDDKATFKGSEIVMNERLQSTDISGRLNILVSWSPKMLEQYNTGLFSSLPEVFKSGFFAKRPQESVSLYKCLEAFLKEEPLGPEDMWYCPACKQHRQATKKLDLWRLPEILVIHLKRFSYNRFLKNKLETYVDFPTHDLDLSSYLAYKDGKSSYRYMLYAISNHYGSMGGGHYTAFVHQGADRWYDFDDSHVYPISQDKLKTSAAYVLFYRRVEEI
ncbi:PREDICTED: ubiquitin carboxyl-terminal hydrolase 8 [Nicotiana attenuata]|uniref:Ubiquitin carboxyl-terminal hydrolase n=1 Tax=Nicotiana attenuata TaxID=49451 RepID=A0A1J6IJ14_NICAT|nr:PREDICTED: ubiquitin carboxyl-terminal hydrolase 8 [Nicotiana attenuata]OIT05101.1 ubiquitin carboxyl-terminal hydrolase 8 [Nicotiana attenuata]